MSTSRITSIPWGRYNGEEIYLFRIENSQGSFVELTNYGATVVSIVVPDRQGKPGNVVLGFPTLEGYLNDSCYIGSTVGRIANRIGGAKFRLDGNTYHLEPNDGVNTNHGGINGFNSKVFQFSVSENVVSFSVSSNDGEGGYPGTLQFRVDYSWSDDHALSIHYFAITDKKTIANFTNHAYFNLSAGQQNIFDHELTLSARERLESGRDYIPTGRVIPVTDQSFDHHRIKDRITMRDGKMSGANFYYIRDNYRQKEDEPLCTLIDPRSGRVLEVFTTYPGVQLYTGDYLESSYPGHSSQPYKPFDGVCLECQYYPDSANHLHFPSTVLDVGQVYHEHIRFRFSVKK